MSNYTVTDTCTLPSKGKVYDTPFNPNIELRSMTVEDEMLRLNVTDKPHKLLSEIIDRCIVGEKPPISPYDMCLGDYQYLVTRLRMVTYGSKYKVTYTCRYCGLPSEETLDLGEFAVREFDENFDKIKNITLPKSGNKVSLRMQTPRMLDEISSKSAEIRKKNPAYKGDPAFLLSLQYAIDTVDGEKLNVVNSEDYVKGLSAMDANYIRQCSDRLNNSIGVDTSIEITCDVCGVSNDASFRFDKEFWMPSIDIEE